MAGILRMIVVLSLICGLAGFTLSYLRINTANRIEEQVLTYVQRPALMKIFGQTQNDPIADRKRLKLANGKEVFVFPAKRDGKVVAFALEAFYKGYGDDVGVMVAIDNSGEKLIGIGITTMRETPGLGTRIAEPRFTKQFMASSLDVNLKSKGGKIDAVSGATISSNAAVEAVRLAGANFQSIQKELAAAFN